MGTWHFLIFAAFCRSNSTHRKIHKNPKKVEASWSFLKGSFSTINFFENKFFNNKIFNNISKRLFFNNKFFQQGIFLTIFLRGSFSNNNFSPIFFSIQSFWCFEFFLCFLQMKTGVIWLDTARWTGNGINRDRAKCWRNCRRPTITRPISPIKTVKRPRWKSACPRIFGAYNDFEFHFFNFGGGGGGYCPVMLSHFLDPPGNHPRRAIFPEMWKINQSSLDFHCKPFGWLIDRWG